MDFTFTLPSVVLESWHFSSRMDSRATVLPDGCRDLILRIGVDGRPAWFVSDLADRAYAVGSKAGEVFVGYRLQPGAMVREAELLAAIQGRPGLDPLDVLPLIEDFVRLDGRLVEALEGLALAGSVAAACALLGVSERSLERLVRAGTGQTPGYWKGLARVRRAAGVLAGSAGLSEVALAQGYADQAHMCREFKKWFGISPAGFRDHANLLALVAEAGYR